jgi:hypothetical protein
VAQTFQIRSTAATLVPGQRPDELMIDWGGLPSGSVASIYLPQTSASAVLLLAVQLYSRLQLRALDERTIQCPASDLTYVPIPPGVGRFTGLLTIDSSDAAEPGTRYVVTVRQLTSAAPYKRSLNVLVASGETASQTRHVLGIFQFSIEAQSTTALRTNEEWRLSICRWILQSTPEESRWYLPFRRYVAVLSDRVASFGGNPDAVGPSATGNWHGAPDHLGHDRR